MKLLLRDGYDARILLSDVNRVLVSAPTAEELATKTTELLKNAMRSHFCFVFLCATPNHKARIIGDADGMDTAELTKLFSSKELSRKYCPGILQTEKATDSDLLQGLQAKGIAVLACLDNGDRDIHGFVVLGKRPRGAHYGGHDLQVIGQIAAELVFAIQKSIKFEESEKFNAILQQRVEHATQRLRQTNAKLKALDQTKDDFISMASHQLRTPLTSVKGYVSMVLEGDAGKLNETQQKLLNQAFISSQRMVYLISDLLNVSRMKTGKFVLESIPCDLSAVVEEEVAQLVETAKSRNLELSYEKPDHFPTYMLDETKLRQVIMNFIDNAIYYTPDEGHIVVTLNEKPTSIELLVTDDGMGVPKSEQHRLFTKFFRAHNAKRARPDGTGLGLYMARKVVVAQGGAIIFRSKEGKGSTFGFTFAKSKLQVMEAAKK